MLQMIESELQDYANSGEVVEAIQLSQIAMDHLRAELSNLKETPDWLSLVCVTKNFQEHRIITRQQEQVSA